MQVDFGRVCKALFRVVRRMKCPYELYRMTEAMAPVMGKIDDDPIGEVTRHHGPIAQKVYMGQVRGQDAEERNREESIVKPKEIKDPIAEIMEETAAVILAPAQVLDPSQERKEYKTKQGEDQRIQDDVQPF